MVLVNNENQLLFMFMYLNTIFGHTYIYLNYTDLYYTYILQFSISNIRRAYDLASSCIITVSHVSLGTTHFQFQLHMDFLLQSTAVNITDQFAHM